ncbi:MAG: S-adenosylmethionine:tRNA ribosyltransferase-isomerase, partial [Acidimicrobiales bacterium]|nr:S-adenosylmethionine:tRNA ribosyltransferase-isomerase [Acidimicrobiales bacterium]
MHLNEFDYDLPDSAIAQEPLPIRTDSRLLIDIENQIRHSRILDFPEIIKPGDLIVMNNTRVLPARFHTRKPTGGKVEILLLEESGKENQWEALVKPSRKVDPGTVFELGEDFEIEVQDDLGEGLRKVRLDVKGEFIPTIEKYGEMPLPPYIKTKLEDGDRYQTVYSEKAKSAAAPTAGLHMTKELLDRCIEKGAKIEFLELVVGLDTFRPLNSQNIDDHKMHSEFYNVPENVI